MRSHPKPTVRTAPARCRRWPALGLIAVAVALPAAGCGGGDERTPPPPADRAGGQRAFDANCASCHGKDARGTDIGPPLVHRIYEPSHHANAAFVLAVRRGSPAHHWSFGDMPPVPGVTDQDISNIVAYVRALQQDAGIT